MIGRAIRLKSVALAALCLCVQPALAIDWVAEFGGYQLSGAALFRLRDQLPAETVSALGAIRNQQFATEQTFHDAVSDAAGNLPDTDWQLLVNAARQAATRIGVEERGEGAFTLYVSPPDLPTETTFAARSWLPALPALAETPGLTTQRNEDCVEFAVASEPLFSACDADINAGETRVTIHFESDHVYGLGQHFTRPGETGVNRINQSVDGTNAMTGFNGGANGNTLIPIAYFDGEQPFALLLDNRYPQDLNFEAETVTIIAQNGVFDLLVLTGETLPDLRRRFMQLSGTPPVLPKAFFGLWLSEYGFDDWGEAEDRLATLEANNFPVSGVVLDLQWFGGIRPNSVSSPMGSLTWDLAHFPDPAAHIADLRARGIGVMLIEESYISQRLRSFLDLAERGDLIHDEEGEPLLTSPTGHWWGRGSMIDWINPDAGAYWHQTRRGPLIDMGIIGHWTDLGEPEMFNPGALYGPDDDTHLTIHNSYNAEWLASIAEGYAQTHPGQRPFMMSRSGAMGIQTLGATMWSGDTGSDFGSLAAQMAEQTHMMWSGIDYYGSDVGGFHRSALSNFPRGVDRDEAMDVLYTQWLAYSALFEVPVRPHTENLCNCRQTAPDRIGDLASNRANLQLRYAMLPYYYSLAHRAYRIGEPLFPSLDYVFPNDPQAAGIGHEKMIGTHLLGAAVAEYGAVEVPVYLPDGEWYDFRSGAFLGEGGRKLNASLARDGLFQLPLFARSGALVPVDQDGELTLLAFGLSENSFLLVDDDGESTAYRSGVVDEIPIEMTGTNLLIDQRGAGEARFRSLVWHLPPATPVGAILVNGQAGAASISDGRITLDLPDADHVEVELQISG